MTPGRRLLHRQAAQGHREHAQALRPVRLHRFRPRARLSTSSPNTDQIDLTLTADEGKQFFIRRIDFSGNTTTRDKVIRREILLDEGDMFNTQLWDFSILRLNQLGYFEMLKKEEAADIKRNPQTNTVDITLKVKERGKNSIGLNGGVSGIAGSFVGFNYSTNNFLGLGETLSLESQLGTRMRRCQPRLHRAVLPGPAAAARLRRSTCSRFDFNQGREASILAGQNLIPLYNQLGSQNLLNYIQNSHGFTVSASYPLAAAVSRASASPTATIFRTSVTQTTAADELFPVHQFQRRRRTQCAARHPHQPHHAVVFVQHGEPSHHSHRRQEPVLLRCDFAGSVLGGNVNTIRPTIDLKYFKPAPWHQDAHPGVPRHGLADHRLRRQVRPAVLAHLHGRRAGCPRLRDLGHHAHRLHSLQHRRQRVEQRRHRRAPRKWCQRCA